MNKKIIFKLRLIVSSQYAHTEICCTCKYTKLKTQMNESCKICNGRHLPVMRTVSIREVPTLPRESVGVIMRSYPVAVASIMSMVAWIPPARRTYNMAMAII